MCPQLQEGKELSQIYETFGFPPLIRSQLLTSVLAIEQAVQAFVNSLWKPEAFQIPGELELDENLLRHADPFDDAPQAFILHAYPSVGVVNLDEGFGTLDPDTLALVSETLQEDGRMVGIITHIPELRDELEIGKPAAARGDRRRQAVRGYRSQRSGI